MRKLTLINYMGANGVGKSTRTFHMVKYLQDNFESQEFQYVVSKKGQEPKEMKVGILFENGWLVLGSFAKGKTQWVSLDSAIFSKWEQRLAFIKDISENYPEISTVFMEGYFNNRSKQSSPESWKDHGADYVHILTSYYDDIQDFIDRTNGRTGKDRGLDWAENSPGWKDNVLFKKLTDLFIPMAQDGDVVERLDIHSPKEVLIHRYFEDEYNSPKPKTVRTLF